MENKLRFGGVITGLFFIWFASFMVIAGYFGENIAMWYTVISMFLVGAMIVYRSLTSD